jgi:hypothetical protein
MQKLSATVRRFTYVHPVSSQTVIFLVRFEPVNQQTRDKPVSHRSAVWAVV